MDVHTANPLKTRLKRLDELLSGQVVQTDIAFRGGENPRLEWVKGDSLDRSLGLAEGGLGCVF